MAFLPIPSTSLQYVAVDVTGKAEGLVINVTDDTVQMAFVEPDAIPGSGDWKTASWESDLTGRIPVYTALCLIGPGGGTIQLAAGNYAVFVKVSDNPEVPVIPVPGLLTIL